MKVRPWAEFTSDLPDDQIEENDEIVQLGGKGVLAAIGDMLTDLGCTVSPPICAHDHGWELDVRFGKRQLWCQITLIHQYVFVFKDMTWRWNPFAPRHHSIYLDLLNQLAGKLAEDHRFHNALWYEPDKVMTAGAGFRQPVGD